MTITIESLSMISPRKAAILTRMVRFLGRGGASREDICQRLNVYRGTVDDILGAVKPGPARKPSRTRPTATGTERNTIVGMLNAGRNAMEIAADTGIDLDIVRAVAWLHRRVYCADQHDARATTPPATIAMVFQLKAAGKPHKEIAAMTRLPLGTVATLTAKYRYAGGAAHE